MSCQCTLCGVTSLYTSPERTWKTINLASGHWDFYLLLQARPVVKQAKNFHLSILNMWKRRTSDGS